MSVRKISRSGDMKIKQTGWWTFSKWYFEVPGARWIDKEVEFIIWGPVHDGYPHEF
ncbi:MAG: hypothetical protein OXU67_02245 [Chloroflexota bacterium]|nr:hypothetical protein [Chloroflexota bacterium]